MTKIYRKCPGVFLTDGPISVINKQHMEMLVEDAQNAPLKRSRICLHKDQDDPVQEMIIAILNDSFIAPHKHLGKSESFHAIQGTGEIYFFDDAGNIKDMITLGENTANGFCYRLSAPVFHTVISAGPVFVVHEILNGPFCVSATQIAPFAPNPENDKSLAEFKNRLADFKRNRHAA